MSSSTMIRLKSSDGVLFEVEESIASQMSTIKAMIDDDCAGGIFPLPNVSSAVLARVLEYCRKHAEAASAEKEEDLAEGDEKKAEPAQAKRPAADALKDWDSDFVSLPYPDLSDIILAANYLGHKGLLGLTCQVVADMIKDYTPEQVRSTFNIVCDFTPEEEQKLRAENAWAF